jgi:hypothetical protein
MAQAPSSFSYAGTKPTADYLNNAGLGSTKFDQSLFGTDSSLEKSAFSVGGVPDYGGDLLASPPGSGGGEAWVFITAPGSVQWNVSSDVQRIDIFGTNAPPVTASSRGMRDLQLTEALMEGFTLGKAVQNELDQLEKLMNVEVNSKDGFVSVPVYDVKAGGKSYGLYVIESIDVDEQMRDLQGRATRAMVGVSLKQVPLYQVGNGIDQAGAASGGQALDASKFTQADKQATNVANNKGNTASNATAQAAANAGKTGAGAAGNNTPVQGRAAGQRTNVVN